MKSSNLYQLKATHASSNTLPGLKSLFERKLEERKHFDASHIRGSPEIGNIFINYPGAGGSDRKMLKNLDKIYGPYMVPTMVPSSIGCILSV